MKAQVSTVQKWLAHFAAYEKEFSQWEKRADKILKRYRDEDRKKQTGTAKFNILWANVQTLIPATFSRIPQADVSRRFKDNDQVGRVASLILERAIGFEIEHYPDFADTMKACVFDRFLGGRGTAWARYEPHITAQKKQEPTDGVQITEDVDEPDEELDYECAPVDYVHWKDFGHTVARKWEEVTGVWRCVYLTKDAATERFGEEKTAQLSFDTTPEELKKGELGGQAGNNSEDGRAEVYEVWDKENKKALWISKSLPEPLDELDDPLKLEEFWPCPKPLFATLTNESLVPVPDFTLYQDQARALDTIAERLQGLIEALQVKGVYDSAEPALGRLFTEGQNGTLIPVKNWAAFVEKNGLKGSLDLVDLTPIYEALRACYDAADRMMKQIYDITGLSDIIRGQSDAQETATAQQIKGQYASMRLKAMQTEVARFASDLIRIKAQIICGKFDPQTIAKMAAVDQLTQADQQLAPQAGQLLLGARFQDPSADPDKNPTRDFRIEVNSDSMVMMDEQQEKQNRMEFLQAVGAYFEKAAPLVQQEPQSAPIVAALLKFGVQGFKIGKTIEGQLDQAIDQLTQQAAQPQPPKADPEMARVQADQQIQMARIQSEAQLRQQEMQADQQQAQQKMQQEMAIEQQRQQAEGQRHLAEIQAQSQSDQQNASLNQQTELKKALLDGAIKLEIARITASKDATEGGTPAAGLDVNQIIQQLAQTHGIGP